MKEPYSTLYNLAEPFLQTRNNDIHTQISYSYAKIICHKENGDPSIVYPGIILHDTGWSKIPEYLHTKAYGPGNRDRKLNRIHEIEGAKIAESLLQKIDYPKQMINEIVTIIEGHDSRQNSISLNDAIVKDADKLWRYSKTGMDIGMEKFSLSPSSYICYIESHIEEWFLTDSGRNLAYQELVNRKEDWSLIKIKERQ
ncbi:MAG TPA: HD domain-containing protein [Desulfohalobiaceae bacterium]|nr:HD domain-containing protein [Desulfohalobiaceae bacterium]